jgi:hypothetical protein
MIQAFKATSSTYARSLEDRAADVVSVKDFGALGNSGNDTVAINAALAVLGAHGAGTLLFPGSSAVYVYNGTLAVPKGVHLQGDGMPSTNSAFAPTLLINAGTSAAVTITDGSARIEHLRILNNGGTGIGVYANQQLVMEHTVVNGFVKTNLLIEAATGTYPYYSVISDSSFTNSQEHGAVIGNGANAVTIRDCRFFWNGFTGAGGTGTSTQMDGLFVGISYNPNGVAIYGPQSVAVTGGDASYNSRYGWNFDTMGQAPNVQPGYSELNKSDGTGGTLYQYQAHVGNAVYGSFISFGSIDAPAIRAEAAYYRVTHPSTILAGGTWVPQAKDNGDPIGVFNLANLKLYLAQTSTGVLYFGPSASGTDMALLGSSTTTLTIGGNTYKLLIQPDVVALPQVYYQVGGSANYKRYLSTDPGTSACTLGDVVWNASPGSWNAPLGWVCVVGGGSGTWGPIGMVGASSDVPTTLTYTTSTPMTPNCGYGRYKYFLVNATDGSAMTIANGTTLCLGGGFLTFKFKNTSGGAMGAITWGSMYHFAGGVTSTNPGNGYSRIVQFGCDVNACYEAFRSTADIAN